MELGRIYREDLSVRRNDGEEKREKYCIDLLGLERELRLLLKDIDKYIPKECAEVVKCPSSVLFTK